jgi:hypothetical protein
MPLDFEGQFLFTTPEEDARISAWLLGRLPEKEAAELEERMFLEEGFYLALAVREDELIRDYLAGDLNSRDHAGFERRLFADPALRKKVRAAAALKAVTVERGGSPATDGTSQSWWRSLAQFAQPALALGLLLLAGLAGWQEFEIRRTADSVRALSLSASKRGKATGTDLVPEFALSATLYRDSRERPTVLSIPDGPGTVTVRFDLNVEPAGRAEKYRISLSRVGEEAELWSQFVVAQGDPVIAVPATLLRRADYIVTLDSAAGSRHESYAFRVDRSPGSK